MLRSLKFPHPSSDSGSKVGTKVEQNEVKEHEFLLVQCVSNRVAQGLSNKDAQGFDVEE
jgi:hypothetical protein